MRLAKFLLLSGLATAAAPAAAGVTVIGNTAARACFEAAESGAKGGEGLERCDEALAQESSLTERDATATYVNRGILKLRFGRLDEAVADFDTAIARDPREGDAYVNKGMATLKRQGNWREAVGLFDEGLRKRTRRPAVAYFGRGAAHELGGDLKQAWLDYRQASLIEQKWRDPQVELARFTVRAR
jgi:tetratricopeptide (TPR) repeat protein